MNKSAVITTLPSYIYRFPGEAFNGCVCARIRVSLFAEVREQKVESGEGMYTDGVRYSQIILAHEHDSLFFRPNDAHERDDDNNNNNNIKRRGGSNRPSNSRSDPTSLPMVPSKAFTVSNSRVFGL
jgi:hypothetical protein